MIGIEFSEAEKEVLSYERYNNPHPRVRQKMEVLWLKSNGLPHHQIAKLAGISDNTLCNYLNEYKEGGIERLKQVNFYRPESELEQHRATIEAYFKEHPPTTIKEAMAKIEELTAIKRSPTQVREFLKKIGMRCLKVGVIPDKADPDEQEEFKKKVGAALTRGEGR